MHGLSHWHIAHSAAMHVCMPCAGGICTHVHRWFDKLEGPLQIFMTGQQYANGIADCLELQI